MGLPALSEQLREMKLSDTDWDLPVAGKREEISYEQGLQAQALTSSGLDYGVSDCTKTIEPDCWKTPHKTCKCPLRSCGWDPGKYEIGRHTSAF